MKNATLGTILSADTIDTLLLQKPSATTTRSRDLVITSLKKQSIKSIEATGDMVITLDSGAVQSMPMMRYVLASLGSVDRLDRLIVGHCGQQYCFADSQHLLEGSPKVVTQSYKATIDLSESEKVLLPLATGLLDSKKKVLQDQIKVLQDQLAGLTLEKEIEKLAQCPSESVFIDTLASTSYSTKDLKASFEAYTKALKAEHSYRYTSELSRKGVLYAVIKVVMDDKSFPYLPKDAIDALDEKPFESLTLALKGDFSHLQDATWSHWQVQACTYMDIFGMTQVTLKPII